MRAFNTNAVLAAVLAAPLLLFGWPKPTAPPAGQLDYATSYFSGGQAAWLFRFSPPKASGTMYRPGLVGALPLKIRVANARVISFASAVAEDGSEYSFLGRRLGGGWVTGAITIRGRSQRAFRVLMRSVGTPRSGGGPRSGLYSNRRSIGRGGAGDLVGNDFVLLRATGGAFGLWEDYEGRPGTPLAASSVGLSGNHLRFALHTGLGTLRFTGVFHGARLALTCRSEPSAGGCPGPQLLTWRESIAQLLRAPTSPPEGPRK
ncbi:MAG: hypothetical protein ACRD2E_07940 [Terriglobales bacterium]